MILHRFLNLVVLWKTSLVRPCIKEYSLIWFSALAKHINMYVAWETFEILLISAVFASLTTLQTPVGQGSVLEKNLAAVLGLFFWVWKFLFPFWGLEKTLLLFRSKNFLFIFLGLTVVIQFTFLGVRLKDLESQTAHQIRSDVGMQKHWPATPKKKCSQYQRDRRYWFSRTGSLLWRL